MRGCLFKKMVNTEKQQIEWQKCVDLLERKRFLLDLLEINLMNSLKVKAASKNVVEQNRFVIQTLHSKLEYPTVVGISRYISRNIFQEEAYLFVKI